MQAKKILITAASAGGGHMSNAYSLEAWIKTWYPHVEVEIYDVFKHLPRMFGRDPVSLFYYLLSVHTPGVWKWFVDQSFKSGDPQRVDRLFIRLGPFLGLQSMRKKLSSFQPDVIISTYPPVMAPLKLLLRRMQLTIPTRLLVTDIFSAPLYWMGGSADEYFVMSQEAKQQVRRILPDHPVTLMPPLLHPKFFAKLPSQKRNRKPHIVLLAGGEGVHKLNALAAVLARLDQYILTVVCGKDRLAYNLLKQQSKVEKWKHFYLHGFTSSIEKILADADCVITKAGPATIFEILRLKKPLICYHYIYGTEAENLEFLEKNKYGVYQPNIHLIPSTIQDILTGKIHFETYELKPDYKQALHKMLTCSPVKIRTSRAKPQRVFEH